MCACDLHRAHAHVLYESPVTYDLRPCVSVCVGGCWTRTHGHADFRRDEASSDEAERSASLRKESRSGSGVGGGGGKRKRSLSALKPGDLDGDSVEEVMVLSSDENEHGEDNDMLFANALGSRTPRQRDDTEKVSGRGKGVGGVSPEMMRPSKKMKKVKHTVVVEDAAAAGEEEEMMFGGDENKGSGGKNKGRKGKKANQHALFDADAFHR